MSVNSAGRASAGLRAGTTWAVRAAVLVSVAAVVGACTSDNDAGRIPSPISAPSGSGASQAADRILAAADDSGMPPWVPDSVECRPDPMDHVHDPSRFVLQRPCATVSGTVVFAELVRAFGDYKITIRPDPGEETFLPEVNAGVFVAAVIPTDRPFMEIPDPGDHATFYGAWVQQVDGGAAAMHPTWAIRPDGPTQPPVPVSRDLRVAIEAPESVVLGDRIDPKVRVTSRASASQQLDPQKHLFLELATLDGNGVAWKAAETNTLREAAIDLVALQIPGDYELSVYAWLGHHYGVASTPVTIRRS